MAAWMPSKAPRSSSRIFPPALPTSSAGVPMTLMVRPSVVGHFGRREGRANGRCGDDVVAAGVADAGKAIVFGANADVQRPGSGAGAERRWEVGNAFLHCETGVGQKLTEPGRGLLFFEAQFGMGMDAVAELY